MIQNISYGNEIGGFGHTNLLKIICHSCWFRNVQLIHGFEKRLYYLRNVLNEWLIMSYGLGLLSCGPKLWKLISHFAYASN